MTTFRTDCPRRGLKREEAALYVGIGATKFDEMVADKRMPEPKQVDGRVVWDRVALDVAFDALPNRGDRVSAIEYAV